VQASSSNGSSSWAQTMASSNPALCIPISVMTDSYKASHFLQYPTSKKMVAVSIQQMQTEEQQHHTHVHGASLDAVEASCTLFKRSFPCF
jgi:hypothetical protein